MTLTALTQATGLSRALSRLLDSRPEMRPELEAALHAPYTAADMDKFLTRQALDETTLKAALRQLRARVFARIAARDLAGLADLGEVTETMTLLAEVSVTTALRILHASLAARYGEPCTAAEQAQQMMVIGMGKLGGRELNVSSDIDLIFIYAEDGETNAASAGTSALSNFDFFTRLGRKLIEALAEITEDGQVFRVDMRLRPNGDSGPLVCGLDMLENYFATQGREWERYAWIKARLLNDAANGGAGLAAVSQPFIFRKYLDFGAFNAMRELHAQIRLEVARRDRAHNIKLGPGGIREIEFIAQVFQLIRGGRDTALRIRPTLQVLKLLGERGILPAEAVAELSAAYDFLRRLEHRLQYLDDQQTHDLPGNDADRALIGRSMGFNDYAALSAALDVHRHHVSRHFEAVFAEPQQGNSTLTNLWLAPDGAAAIEELSRLGYHDATAAAQRLSGLRASGRYQQMPSALRSRFDVLIPRLIEVSSATPQPDATLLRCLDLLHAISKRGAYLALLQQYPQALKKLADLAGSSGWAAAYLTQHPVLLDELLDARLLEIAPDGRAFNEQLTQQLDAAEPDIEHQMDLMREAHHAQVFRLLLQDIAGLLPLERLSDHLSDLADILLGQTLRLTWRHLLKRHCEQPRFAVIAYGKLGGRELGYASDLDLVFLYDDDDELAAEIYARLAQRMLTWLSSRTSAGILFETDTRLRPNGESGLLVSSVAAFRQYQTQSAWDWEHQALTRGRFCAGDADIGQAFDTIRNEVLRQPRDLDKLRGEVLTMRGKMLAAHTNNSGLFDIKHDRGGLIDVEFIVQYLVLGYAAEHPEFTGNLGNIALLKIAAGLGLIPIELSEKVRDAYRELRRLQHGLRLNGAEFARVEPAAAAAYRDAVLALWREVFAEQ